MDTIGVIGAMDEEVEYLKSKLELVSAKNIVGVDYYMGKLFGKNVVLVRSGIGKVNAAICTQILIDMYGVDYIINTGIAGSIDSSLVVGDLVISSDAMQHDFDVTAFGYDIGVIPRLQTSTFVADELLINLAVEAAKNNIVDNNYFVGRVVSGDVFVSTLEDKQRISKNFKGLCAEMEGAAIAQTCYLNKIPFVIIRGISDEANEKATETYAGSIETAIKNSSIVTEEIVKNI